MNIIAQISAQSFLRPEFFEKRIIVSENTLGKDVSRMINYNTTVGDSFTDLLTSYPSSSSININTNTNKINFLKGNQVLASLDISSLGPNNTTSVNNILNNI